ncbi:esterase 1 [Mycena leptocephala]|nr:esterase 1 [Mycena leptocephala]
MPNLLSVCWRLARPVAKFSLGTVATFDATSFGASCIQPASPFIPAGLPMSEDCLTINVFRPAGLSSDAGVPVMAWIFGGSFFTGTPVTFDASELVSQSVTRETPIIYVSFNYRLGPLGFPQGPEAASRGVLNLGLRDQTLALEWVQQNIAAFGGDPAKVTLFGQSAALCLLDYYISTRILQIFQSGQPGTTVLFDANRAIPQWLVFANTACGTTDLSANDTFSCLLETSTDDILAGEEAGVAALVGEFPFYPVLDGPGGIVPTLPSLRLSSGAGGNVPFIAGSVLDDGVSFNCGVLPHLITPASVGTTSVDQIVSQISTSFTPCCPFNTGTDTFGFSSEYKRAAALLGDVLIQAPRRFWSQTASAGGTTVYSYMFIDPQPQNPPFLGVAHLSELPYIYGGITGPDKVALSVMMQDYWISFATSLDPNDGKGSTRPTWEEYGVDQRIIQLNSTGTTMIADDFRQDQMSFINDNAAVFSQ